jgi:hypothetical protein
MSGAKAGYNYRLLLIGRDYDEILASQVKMIDSERRNRAVSGRKQPASPRWTGLFPECRSLRREEGFHEGLSYHVLC